MLLDVDFAFLSTAVGSTGLVRTHTQPEEPGTAVSFADTQTQPDADTDTDVFTSGACRHRLMRDGRVLTYRSEACPDSRPGQSPALTAAKPSLEPCAFTD